MAEKKSFKQVNPALSFIESGSNEAHTDTHTDTYTHTDQHTPVYTHAHADTYTQYKRENKSRRLQLLIKPSTHNAISEIAQMNDTSINDTINTILENYLRKGDV